MRAVFVWMAGKDGGSRAEWIEGGESGSVWVFWKRPEEWAEVLSGWVSRCFLLFFEEEGGKGEGWF